MRIRIGNSTDQDRAVKVRYVAGAAGRLWTCSQGEGAPIILCNGGPGCCDYLAPVAAMLHDHFRVIRFEQCGCGRSEPAPCYTLAGCLEDLEAIRQFYGLEQWWIGGHSWGADLALLYTLHYPQRVRGFVCLAGGRVHNDREWHQAYEAGKAQEVEVPPLFAYAPNMQVNEQLGRDWKQYIQRPNLLKEIAQLDRPALFVYGDRDIRPSWPSEQVANLLPRAQFIMLSGADHHLWATHGDAVRTALLNLLRTT